MSRSHAVLASMVAMLFAVVACQDQGRDATQPLAPDALSMSTAPAANVIATEDLPPHPESAVHDVGDDAYLVSNLGARDPAGAAFAHLFDQDDNGFISRVDLHPDGSVASVTKHWIGDPSLGPTPTFTADVDGITGITIQGGDLYAVDRDEILVFDLSTQTFKTSIPLPASGEAASPDLSLPNDVVVETDGTVWLTDTGLAADASRTNTDAVWKWDGSSWSKEAGGPAGASLLGCPNGIDLNDSGNPLFLTFCLNKVQEILGTDNLATVATVQPNPASGAGVGRLDGLVVRGDGSLLFSDWRVPQDAHGRIHRHRPGQGVAATGLNLPADIGFDAGRQRVLIPSDGDQQLKIVRVR